MEMGARSNLTWTAIHLTPACRLASALLLVCSAAINFGFLFRSNSLWRQ
jgi:hypothetical protein